MGVDDNLPPFEYLNENQEFLGVAADNPWGSDAEVMVKAEEINCNA